MSYYISPESRRCRRCKRKRLDDEPPEVRQYKTCAKCRIIERQKKKSKKPLAEETMVYGLRQLQEQQPGSWSEDFFQDDIYMEDAVRPRKRTGAGSSSPTAAAAAAAAVNHSSLVATAAAAVSAATGAGGAQDAYSMYGYEVDPSSYHYEQQQREQQQQHQQQQHQQYQQHQYQQQHQNQHQQQHQQHQQNQQQQFVGRQQSPSASYEYTPAPSTPDPNGGTRSAGGIAGHNPSIAAGVPGGAGSGAASAATIAAAAAAAAAASASPLTGSCDVCSAKFDTTSLCDHCQANPYVLPHVYSDFTTFLQEIAPESNLEADAATLTFIKEVVAATDFNENLDTNNVNPQNERQYRELVLSSIKQIYLNPVMAASGFKFTRVSSNLAAASSVASGSANTFKNAAQPIKAIFKCKAGDDAAGALIPNIELFVSYSLSTNVIVIRVTRDVDEIKVILEARKPKESDGETAAAGEAAGEDAAEAVAEAATTTTTEGAPGATDAAAAAVAASGSSSSSSDDASAPTIASSVGEGDAIAENNAGDAEPAAAGPTSYPLKFVNLVDRTLKSLSDESTHPDAKLGYDTASGLVVYSTLIARRDEYPEEIRALVDSFSGASDFADKFVNFKSATAAGDEIRPADAAANGSGLAAVAAGVPEAAQNGDQESAADASPAPAGTAEGAKVAPPVAAGAVDPVFGA